MFLERKKVSLQDQLSWWPFCFCNDVGCGWPCLPGFLPKAKDGSISKDKDWTVSATLLWSNLSLLSRVSFAGVYIGQDMNGGVLYHQSWPEQQGYQEPLFSSSKIAFFIRKNGIFMQFDASPDDGYVNIACVRRQIKMPTKTATKTKSKLLMPLMAEIQKSKSRSRH